VGPRTGLDEVEKRKLLTLPGLEHRSLCCPACSQSLYRLSYPGCNQNFVRANSRLTCRWCSSCRYSVLRLMSAAVNSRGSVSGAMSDTGPNTEAPKEVVGNPCCKLNRITTFTRGIQTFYATRRFTIPCCVCQNLPLVPNLSHMNPVQLLTSYFFGIHFNIILPSMSAWPCAINIQISLKHARCMFLQFFRSCCLMGEPKRAQTSCFVSVC
jgi:hypothetical protein